MRIPVVYTSMNNCPICGAELVWVCTPIDDLKECPGNMDHTVFVNQIPFTVPNLKIEVVHSHE